MTATNTTDTADAGADRAQTNVAPAEPVDMASVWGLTKKSQPGTGNEPAYEKALLFRELDSLGAGLLKVEASLAARFGDLHDSFETLVYMAAQSRERMLEEIERRGFAIVSPEAGANATTTRPAGIHWCVVDRDDEFWPFAARDIPPDSPDAMLWTTAPTLVVPRTAEFVPLRDNGHRFLLASDGLWLECRRPWLHLIHRLAVQNRVAMPYGQLKPRVDVAFGKVPQDMIRQFTERGRTSLPNECGAWISYEHGFADTAARLVWSEACDTVGTPGSLDYTPPQHFDQYSPCIDMHTHGAAPAFFSPTDDADDAGDVKIAIVIGDLDKPTPSLAARLCCLGLFIPIAIDPAKVFAS